jgi:hypothetical protein
LKKEKNNKVNIKRTKYFFGEKQKYIKDLIQGKKGDFPAPPSGALCPVLGINLPLGAN